jgi:hypothetical protein
MTNARRKFGDESLYGKPTAIGAASLNTNSTLLSQFDAFNNIKF